MQGNLLGCDTFKESLFASEIMMKTMFILLISTTMMRKLIIITMSGTMKMSLFISNYQN